MAAATVAAPAVANIQLLLPIAERSKLPVRLIRFFKRFPPEIYSARATGVMLPLTREDAKARRIAEAAAEAEKQEAQTVTSKKARRSKADAATTTATTTPTTVPTTANDALSPILASAVEPSATTSVPQPESVATTTSPLVASSAEVTLPTSAPLASDVEAATPMAPPLSSIMAPSIATSEPQPQPTTSTPVLTSFNGRKIDGLTRATRFPSNPFLPFKNPTTGNWISPKYSLREQADLCKIARQHSVEDLLPPSRKSSAFKQARILQKGLRVRGTGEGQKVKGHIWERQMPAMLEKRKEALRQMPQLVRDWQARGNGKGWKAWPKAKTK
jgi:large subunit ribosomal protein L25